MYWHGAGQIQGASEVLVVDGAVSQCYTAAEPLVEPPGSQGAREEVVDGAGFEVLVPHKSGRVAAADPEPTAQCATPSRRLGSDTTARRTGSADNLERITVDGSSNNKDWPKVALNRPGADNVLSWERVPYTF